MPPIYRNEFVIVDVETKSVIYNFTIRCSYGSTREQAIVMGQDIVRNFELQPRTLIYFRTVTVSTKP